MKATFKIFQLAILLIFPGLVLAQNSDDLYEELASIDLTHIINGKSISDDEGNKIVRREPLGYIGWDYRRFRIHFTSFTRDKNDAYVYNVKGKTKVKNNVCDFTGTIKVISASYNAADFNEKVVNVKHGSITCAVTFYEDESQSNAGIISGELITDVYFDEKGKLQYNALWFGSDGFYNNQFIGKWTGYKKGRTLKCNWGDFRIPESNGLDVGAGEFSVAEQYINSGWESYYYSYCCAADIQRTIDARKEEAMTWWE
ncbi:MAG: hypothetical protein DI539_03225 [Flavobacterium psychrophilum]|nr:MAG: hypothetical protein DI539_03225 [Flavobacterium psychrophilum]